MSTTIAKLTNAFAAAAILAGSLAATNVASARDGAMPDIDARPLFLDTVPPPVILDESPPCRTCRGDPDGRRELRDAINRFYHPRTPNPASPQPFSPGPGQSFRFELGR